MAVNINIPSQVSQTITNGVTDKAPSEDAVFDALALKANTADLGATAFSNDYNDLDNLPTIPSVTGFVPYTGATSDLDMGTYNLTADHINLNVSPSGAGFVVGSTQWNNTLGSSETLLKGGSVTLKNGVDLVARIVNKVVPNTTLTKASYQAVKVTGATGGRLSVGLAQGNTDLNSADTIGLVTETIATNQEGFIITVGQIEDINTTGSLQGETWSDGDVLYLSPTVAGKLTNIKPTGATGHIVVMGYVEYAHANHGKIYVKIMNGWELDELHNVSITSPTGGATLQYQASTQLWVDAGIQYTIELVAALTVDFYAPYNMVITSVSNVLNAPTITLQDDNVAYTLGNTIAVGSKVTVTASVASVVNLNITK
jgi:nitrogen fixation protein